MLPRYIGHFSSAGHYLSERESHGQQRQTGRYFLCGPLAGGGQRAGGHPTGPADPVQEGPPTSFQETPRGPARQLRMLSLSVRGVRAFAVFLDGTEELACFFFFKPDHF